MGTKRIDCDDTNESLVRMPNSNNEDDNDDRNNNGDINNNNNNTYDSDNDSDKRYVGLINYWAMWYAASYKMHLFSCHHLLLSYSVTCGHMGQKTNVGEGRKYGPLKR